MIGGMSSIVQRPKFQYNQANATSRAVSVSKMGFVVQHGRPHPQWTRARMQKSSSVRTKNTCAGLCEHPTSPSCQLRHVEMQPRLDVTTASIHPSPAFRFLKEDPSTQTATTLAEGGMYALLLTAVLVGMVMRIRVSGHQPDIEARNAS